MTRESTIEDYLVRRVKEEGGEIRKVQWLGRNGAPDRLAMLPGWHFFVELKAPGKKPEAHQIREHKRMRAAGFEVYVIDSIEAVDALFI